MLPETRKLLINIAKGFHLKDATRTHSLTYATFIVKNSDSEKYPFGLIISKTDGHKLFEKQINDEQLFKRIQGNFAVIVNENDKKVIANHWSDISEIALFSDHISSTMLPSFNDALKNIRMFSLIYISKVSGINDNPDITVSFNVDYLYSIFECVKTLDKVKASNKMITLKIKKHDKGLEPIIVNDCAVLMPMRS